MSRIIHYTLLFMIPLLLPATALADYAFIWTPPSSDKSIEYLGALFGTVGTALTGTGPSLIGTLFNIFNLAVLSIGSVVVSYTIILSTMNTAQEGQVMGQKWSSIWIPMRSAVGMAFLLPTASGYSLIQILLMNIILYGVAAADQIWSIIVTSIGTSQGVMGQVNVDSDQLQGTAQQLFNNMVCIAVINSNPSCQAVTNGHTASYYSQNNNQVNFGIAGDPNYATVCGTANPSGAPSGIDTNAWNSASIAGIQSASSGLNSAAQELYASSNSANWNGQNVIYTAMNTIQANISSAGVSQQATNTVTNQHTEYGWLFAGSYYFELVTKGTQNVNYPPPIASSGDPTALGNACTTQIYNYQAQISSYLKTTEVSGLGQSNTSNSLQLQTPNLSQSNVSKFYDAITSPVRKLTFLILNSITTNADDPLTSLRNVGSTIMAVSENTWFAVVIISFLMLLVSCIMSGMSPLCWAVGTIVSFLVPIISFIIILLWGAGVAIGLYLPLVPYIVFTFTAMGWFLLVIEAIAAAPIVALGLVSPSAEHMGRASGSVLIIANVFLRPSLMLIGFIIAIKLVQAIIAMINYGFQATVEASTGGLGIFGCVALICLYGGLVITVVHECFSLIYVLPDKIMRWIGGAAEQSTVKQSTQEVRTASEKGAEIGSSIIKGSTKVIAKKAEGMAKEAKDKMKSGEGGGDKGMTGNKGGGGSLQVG